MINHSGRLARMPSDIAVTPGRIQALFDRREHNTHRLIAVTFFIALAVCSELQKDGCLTFWQPLLNSTYPPRLNERRISLYARHADWGETRFHMPLASVAQPITQKRI